MKALNEMMIMGTGLQGISSKGIDYKRYWNKNYRYKGYRQQKASITKGIDL